MPDSKLPRGALKAGADAIERTGYLPAAASRDAAYVALTAALPAIERAAREAAQRLMEFGDGWSIRFAARSMARTGKLPEVKESDVSDE